MCNGVLIDFLSATPKLFKAAGHKNPFNAYINSMFKLYHYVYMNVLSSGRSYYYT